MRGTCDGYPLKTPNRNEAAETLALQALAYLAGSETDLMQFVQNSGIGADELRARAGQPDVLRAVLDFLLAEDERLLAFCTAMEIEPREVHVARHTLDSVR
jgi:hypothetical protein